MDSDKVVIVMGAVLEEVSGKRSRKGQAAIGGGAVTLVALVSTAVVAVTKALGF